MLVMSRRVDESVVIRANQLIGEIKVVRLEPQQVKLGFTGDGIGFTRTEIFQRGDVEPDVALALLRACYDFLAGIRDDRREHEDTLDMPIQYAGEETTGRFLMDAIRDHLEGKG